MIKLYSELLSRKDYLEKTLMQPQLRSQALSKSNGSIHAIPHGNGYQYYYRASTTEKYKYVKEKNKYHAAKIVQAEYYHNLIDAINAELFQINKLLKFYSSRSIPENIFSMMSPGKKLLVTPFLSSNEEYAHNWLKENMQSRTINDIGFSEEVPEIYTDTGIRVRSKSEVIISALLEKLEIPYIYEKPLYLEGYGTVHPDFTMLDSINRREIYWEHFGMMDDTDYSQKACSKIKLYENNGYYLGETLLITFETSINPLDIRFAEKKLRNILRLS